MISVQEAITIIENNINIHKTVDKELVEASGYILTQDVLSPINMPPFRQSSMDGYALNLNDVSEYIVVGEVKTGVSNNLVLKENEALRIFTGGRVPDSANTVVIQEQVKTIRGNRISIIKKPTIKTNVRSIGQQIKKNEVALRKGTVLNEAALGFLSGLGIESVAVFAKPSVSILITGDELIQVGQSLKEAQVYDSNSVMLKFALHRLGINDISIAFVPDELGHTKRRIEESLSNFDVTLISGGISVGDYDFVKESLEANNVQQKFYKVNQKPGKPLWFGTKEHKVVFALPGNPASSLTCFYIYVLPALCKMMGHSKIHLKRRKAVTDTIIKNTFAKSLFLKTKVKNGIATPLHGQASSMLHSFVESNALLIVPEDTKEIQIGESVEYIDLDF